jgi:hypothetical protein
MDVRLTAEGGAGTDELRSLLSWLTDEDELRGRAALLESPPVPGTLGPVVETACSWRWDRVVRPPLSPPRWSPGYGTGAVRWW